MVSTMSKSKKPTGGKHATPRRSIALPEGWAELADQLAALKPYPTTWFVIDLIREAAEKAGVKHTQLAPWQKTDTDPPK